MTVSVDDDGPGMPSQRAGARTSLRILDEHLRRFGGAVVAERRRSGPGPVEIVSLVTGGMSFL